MSAAQAEFEKQLAALKRSYLADLPAKIDAIGDAIAVIPDGGDVAAARKGLDILEHLSHQLAGSGATFGLPAVSDAARDIETAVLSALNGESGAPAVPKKTLSQLVDVLRRAAAEGRAAADDAPAPAVEDTPAEAAGPDKALGRTIILIEGDPNRAGQLSGNLVKFGFNVEALIGTEDLGPAMRLHDPLALILDMAFADDHGANAETIWQLRQEGAISCPLIFVSDDGSLAARLAGVRVGCDAYLVKPVDVNEFIDVIERLTSAEEAEPLRVLVVDDDPSTAERTAIILEGAGMITAVVTEPERMLEEFEAFAPELVLLDLYMPGCSGQELAEVIRQQKAYAAVPIVFLSSERDPDKQMGAMSRGGDDFLTKTISPEHLITSVRNRAVRFRTLRTLMIHDSLTGLLNHSTTLQFLDNEVARAGRNDAPLSFAMLDLDHFKSVNDTYGHAVGDMVIKSLATLLKRRLRRVDVVGRMGGEEFGVVLTGTGPEQAQRVMNEVRGAFSDIGHRAGTKNFSVTLSCGIAAFPAYGAAAALVEAADEALYAAKSAGRNRVELAGPPAAG